MSQRNQVIVNEHGVTLSYVRFAGSKLEAHQFTNDWPVPTWTEEEKQSITKELARLGVPVMVQTQLSI